MELPLHPTCGRRKSGECEFVSDRQAFGAQHGPGHMKRGGKAGCAQIHTAAICRITHLQWQAQQCLGRTKTDGLHHLKCLAIGAEQYVLTIVERGALMLDTPRSAAHGARGFEQYDFGAAPCQLDRCSAASPAGADDGDFWLGHQPLTQVFQASHSLRSGVREIL